MPQDLAIRPVLSVTLVTGSLSPLAGGMYFSARLPANVMAARGRPPTVLGLADEQWQSARSTWRTERIEAVPRTGPAGYFATGPLLSKLEAIAPDLVHLRGIWGPYSAAAWRWHRRSGRPVIISTHGMVDEGALRLAGTKKRILGALYEYENLRGATALHALNVAERAAMRALGCDNPIAIIPNGVNIRPPSQKLASVGTKRRLLFLSRLHQKKGIGEMLRAWRIAADVDIKLTQGWTLIIAGWGDRDYVNRMRALARELSITDNVQFKGPLLDDDKRRALDTADAFILPSYSEGLPIAVLEAWERSLPVLMTAACNLPEGFAADAALRTTTDPHELARNIMTLCGLSADERAAIGARGRALVTNCYDWERITDQYLALYDWVGGRSERPDFVQMGS